MNTLLTRTILVLVIVVTVAGGYHALTFVNSNRSAVLENPIAQRMIPLYRSLRKLPDVVFMPWAAFATSNLETYELTISPQNIERMNAVLPVTPFNSSMESDSKLWVKGYFRTADYEGNVNVRYRGNLAAHWNAYQKSYAIKFPKDNLFRGMREMNVIIPSKRRYLGMSLNSYRADKLGLIHPDESLVRLELNGADAGVLLSFEGWSQPWIEKMPISALSTVYGVDEGTTPYRERWDSWNSDEPVDLAPLEALEEIVEHAPDELFAKLIPLLIDIEDWYRWDIMRILASGYHVTGESAFGANNLVMIFDRAEGRFKPVPYNTVIYSDAYRNQTGLIGVRGEPTRLYKRILSIPEFRAHRDKLWNEYVTNEKAADVEYLVWWKETYNREFLLDNAKNDNHFSYLAKIDEYVAAAETHFDDPFGIIDITYEVEFEEKQTLVLPNAFAHLERATLGGSEAATQHSSLIYRADDIYIPPGTHWFPETIIIPANTTLTIAAGATLQFAEDASFISYSPVNAIGTKWTPITIAGYTPDTQWGVFAVLNTHEATSTLTHVVADGGGEATINGAFISGTLAFHNSNITLSESLVKNARGDDGLNIKGGRGVVTKNQFVGNSSDGVDLDYIHPNTLFSNNVFIDNNGDSLDLSWSNITIDKNTISNCVDKGISVGERSQPTITNNIIDNCQIGVAVKDSSVADITNNTISHTHTAVSAYQKKPYFGGGIAILTSNTFLDNDQITSTDTLSVITFE